MRLLIGTTLIGVIALLGGTAIGGQLDNKPAEVVYVPQVIEVPKTTFVETVKVVREIEIVYEYAEPRQFESPGEYFDWYTKYDFDQRKWKAGYDCDDFSMDMAIQALKDGYLIGLCSNTRHMECFVVIDGWLWRAEPQNRSIRKWVPLDR